MKNTIQAVGISATLIVATLALAKPYPAGIVNLTSGQITPTNTIANLANHPWTNPNVRGMQVKTRWNYVQPLQNSYDWTGIDEALRLGSQNGKFVGLSVAAGTSTPQWVYDVGATKYALQDGSGLSMPIPWEAAFLNQWLPFVRALGQRYDGNPALGYVVIAGFAQSTETYLATTAADNAALTALGGAASWVVAAKTIITAYAEAFPTTPFFITMARPFPSTAVGIAALQEVVQWGVATYPGRFGLMIASLSVNSNTGFYPVEAISTYRLTQPTGFQMLCSAVLDPVRLGGTLDQAVANGYQLGGKFIEVYEPDVTGNTSTQGGAVNLSSRLRVLNGENCLIAGFIVSGPKRLILRGLGPSLQPFGIAGFLQNPTLELHGPPGLIATNDDWNSAEAAAIQATGLAPKNNAESAIVTTLESGAYTVILRDRNNLPGIGLVEIYDLDSQGAAKLLNLSTRGFVDTGDNAMIGGFIIGPSGLAKILLMAKGPSLAAAGIQAPLQDPTLELHDANGAILVTNAGWKAAPNQSAISATGLAPTDNRESAILTILRPGAYTAVMRGKNNTRGVGLVEIYRLD